MKKFESAEDLAKEFGIPLSKLKKTFDEYNEIAKKGKDQYGKIYFHNMPFVTNDYFYVA